MKNVVSRPIMLIVIAFIASGCLWAQCTSALSKGNKVSSVPVSKTTLVFETTVPSGKVAKMRILEGGMARVSDSKAAYGIVPIIDGGGAEFTVFAISSDSLGNESASELDRFRTTLGQLGISQKVQKFSIKLLSIDGVPSETPSEKSEGKSTRAPRIITVSGGGDCCVICGDGFFTCANSVCIDGCGECHDTGFPRIECNVNNSQVHLSRFRPLDLKPLELAMGKDPDHKQTPTANATKRPLLANQH